MIYKLKGQIEEILTDGVLIDVRDIVYKVNMSQHACSMIKTGQSVTLLTHLDIKENSHTLYGFLYSDEKEIFELLLQVNGIGPKSALAILNTSNPQTILDGIASHDASHLSKVTGIGKKTAEKIIITLKDKIAHIEAHNHSNKQDAIEALVALGYSQKQARDAVQNSANELTSEEIIKDALKSLGK